MQRQERGWICAALYERASHFTLRQSCLVISLQQLTCVQLCLPYAICTQAQAQQRYSQKTLAYSQSNLRVPP